MPPDPPDSSNTWSPGTHPEPPSDSLGTWAPDVPGRPPTTAPPIEPPAAPRYTDQGLLGRGGIAEVRSVHDARLGREVAVKRLQRVGSRVGRRRFLREARITAQLEHPGIVPIYDAAIGADGVPYYTMKYVRGTALSQALGAADTLDARLRLVPSFTAVCQAMAYAHDRRVIHRDLKPDNVMLGEFGEALVVDWGLARALDEEVAPREPTEASLPPRPLDLDDGALTVQGQVAGTPAYMAPEQARGEPTAPTTDVYALGAILYEILTGDPPHGRTGDVATQLARARDGRVAPVATHTPDAPPELAAIAERALATAPGDRYPSAAELARELERWSTGRLVQAYDYTPMAHLRRLTRQYRVPIALGLAGVLAATAVGMVGFVNVRAERDRLRLSEAAKEREARIARERLAVSHTERALRAMERGDPVEAAWLSLWSLQAAPSPRALGSLSAAWGALGDVAVVSHWAAPHPCRAVAAVADRVLCAGDGQLTALSEDGDALWTVPAPGGRVEPVVLDEQTLAVGTDDGVFRIALSDGSRTRVADDYELGLTAHRGRLGWSAGQVAMGWGPDQGIVTRRFGSTVAAAALTDDGLYAQVLAGRLHGPDDRVITDEVKFDMAPTSSGWLSAGARIDHLTADGIEPLVELDGTTRSVHVADDRAVVVDSLSNVVVIDVRSGRVLLRLPALDAEGAAATFDGADELVVAHGTSVRRVRLPRDTWFPARRGPKSPRTIAFDGGSQLYCLYDGRVVWSRPDTHSEHRFPSSFPGCSFVDGRPAVVANGQLHVLDADTAPVPLPEGALVVVERDGRRLIMAKGALLGPGGPLPGHHIAPTHASDRLVTTGRHEVFELAWDGTHYARQRTVPLPHVLGATDTHAFGREGHDVVVHPLVAGAPAVERLVGHAAPPFAAVGLPGGRVATGGMDHRIHVWDVATGRRVADLLGHGGRIAELIVDEERGVLHSTAFDQSYRTWSLAVLDDDPAERLAELVERLDWELLPEGEALARWRPAPTTGSRDR